MNSNLPKIYLARHGETAWSLSGQHTGRADIPLTKHGEESARRLGKRLQGLTFPHVFTSPLQRAARTGALAGFGAAQVDPDLVEWDYGAYEGKTRAEILKERPDWQLFRDGPLGGESLAELGARADRVIARLRALGTDALLFSSGHILRVLAARWCHLDAAAGRCFYLSTATLSILGYEHNLDEPVIRMWNEGSTS